MRGTKLALLFLSLLTLSVPSRYARADDLLVSAAASLTEALGEAGTAFHRENPNIRVRFNFGASGALQQQIEAGAPVDVFVSASPREMNALQTAGRIEMASRGNIASNRLVLIAPMRSSVRQWNDLRLPGVRRVAVSNPDSVPSGRYARETLTRRGLWEIVAKKAVFGENVRQTLTYVMNGDVDAGLVFATDARQAGKQVRVVGVAAPGKDHEPILYPAGMVVGAKNPEAARLFLRFLRGKTGQSILARYGFLAPPQSAPKSPIKR